MSEDSKELELSKRSGLLEQMIDKCSMLINDIKFVEFDIKILNDLNSKIQDCCSEFDDKFTTFKFNPMTTDEIKNGTATFRSHLRINYHSIDIADIKENATITEWLSIL